MLKWKWKNMNKWAGNKGERELKEREWESEWE